jgi:hypothetical protein
MTASTSKVIEHLEQLGTRFQPGDLVVVPELSVSQERVHQRLVDFAGSQGWVCLTDEVLAVREPLAVDQLADRTVLSAELCAGNKTLVVRQDGAAWSCWQVERTDTGSNDARIIREEMMASKELMSQTGVRLLYEVAWRPVPDINQTTRYAPVAARFAGFVEQTRTEDDPEVTP